MKKKLAVLLLMVVVLSATAVSFAGLACPECMSGTIYTRTDSPTCISDGTKTYYCTDCSFKSIRVLSATGHDAGSDTFCKYYVECRDCGKDLYRGSWHKAVTYVNDDGTRITICAYCNKRL